MAKITRNKPAAEADIEAFGAAADVHPDTAAAPQPSASPARPKKTKLQADTDEELAGRVKAAWHYTPIDAKELSFKEFLLNAIVAEVERREKAYNDGKQYEPLRQKLTPGARVR